MEKKVNYSSIAIIMLAIALIGMSVGFAVFSSNLQINGTAKIASSSWKVEFDPESYEESLGSVSPTSEPVINATSMTYEVTLNQPTEFYEFTIDVKNLGTFNANLTSLTMTDISTHANYLKYTVTYGSQEFTSSNPSLNIPLAATTGSETVKVRVEYLQPSDASLLPTTTQTASLSVALDYTQQ